MTRAALHTSKPNDKWTWEGIAKNADGPSPQRRGGGFRWLSQTQPMRTPGNFRPSPVLRDNSPMPSPVHLLTTGGTIDTVYSGAAGTHRVGPPAAPGILRRARVGTDSVAEAQVLMQKDSGDITPAERGRIVSAVLALPDRARAVLTHGTDTMAETARAVAAENPAVTLVLVGAFVPAAMRESDADFNLGFALAAAQILPAGVYIAMNGKILPAARARKNRQAGRFESAD